MTSLMVALLLLQAESAEDTFKKIGDTVLKAKSVRVDFRWDGTSRAETGGKVEASGLVLLKEGNRANLVATVTEKGQPSELKIISDGSTVKTRLGSRRMLECPVPKNLESGLKMTIHRLGAMQAVLIAHKVCMLDVDDQEEALDMSRKPRLYDFKNGPDDGESRTITYKISPDGPDTVADIKLWYDPDTMRLVKRTITLRKPSESVFTERYRDWALDGDLENEEFTLPSVK
jgi:outer membrane lipoprotein-sorting protein